MSVVRRTPVRHPVTGHKRADGRYVNAYWRGKGRLSNRAARRVVGETESFVQISSPVVGDVIKSEVLRSVYDYDEKVSRPVTFQIVVVTADVVRGHEDEEWLRAFVPVFPTLDNSLREGYTLDDVGIIHDSKSWDKWKITLKLVPGVAEIDTVEKERKAVEDIARGTSLRI